MKLLMFGNFFKKNIIIPIIAISCGSQQIKDNKTIEMDKTNYSTSKEINYIPYYSEIYKADSLYITKNYKQSYKILDSLFKIYKPVDGWYVNVSRNYLISKSEVSIIDYNDVQNYLYRKAYDTNDIFNDRSIVKLLEEFNITKDDVDMIVKQNVSKINMPLRLEINKMNLDDQEVRKTIKNVDSIKKVDWQHSERLKTIIDTYGFPNKNVIGGYRVDGKSARVDLSLIFNHISYNGDYEFFKSKLPQLIKNGTCDPFNYAMMEDRRSEINSELIKYYSIIALDNKADKKIINANRKAIGLPSIEYQEFKKKVMSN